MDKDFLKLDPNLQKAYLQLKPFFTKYYPKAVIWSYQGQDIRFEYETTNFDLKPLYGNGKHPRETLVNGPKKGGIYCQLNVVKGDYDFNSDQLFTVKPKGGIRVTVAENIYFKTLLYFPSLSQEKGHYSVVLRYPAETPEQVLNGFHESLKTLEKP